jgi:hypothetical protein
LKCCGNGNDCMILTVTEFLAGLVLVGTTTIIAGVRYFNLSSKVLTIAFTLTAAAWFAFLIAAISATVILLVVPNF